MATYGTSNTSNIMKCLINNLDWTLGEKSPRNNGEPVRFKNITPYVHFELDGYPNLTVTIEEETMERIDVCDTSVSIKFNLIISAPIRQNSEAVAIVEMLRSRCDDIKKFLMNKPFNNLSSYFTGNQTEIQVFGDNIERIEHKQMPSTRGLTYFIVIDYVANYLINKNDI